MADRERDPERDVDGSAPGGEAVREWNRRRIDTLLAEVEGPSDPELAAEHEARNRRLLRRYPTEILQEGRMDAIDEIFHEDIKIRSRENDVIAGLDALAEYLRTVRASFEDLETDVVTVVASSTEALGWFRVRAIHEEDYFGIDPSGRTVNFPVATKAIVKDGRIIWYGDIVNPRQMEPPSRRYGRSELLDQIREGVVVVDREGRIVQTNPAAEQLLGAEDRDVRNAPVEDLFEEGLTLPETGSTAEVPIDGGRRILDLSVTELTGPQDDRLGRILTFREVTDRVRRRQQLETLNRQNERLDQFVSVVSHDLRNPLKKASGYLDLARESGEDEYFRKVEQSHARVETIVDELLTMARAGVTVEETETVSLTHLVEDAWATARTPGATLETDLPAGACVEADPNLLRHVLENLFRNATDHNDGPITITVGAMTDPPGFSVADDGQGIPESDREEVFDHGYSTDADGTGFGLSIVEQFVAAHGWEVTVTDADGGGARFEIETGNPLDAV